MNNWPDNPAQVQDSGDMENETHELQTETLIEFARDYFAADFPNPDRRDCPDPARLIARAQTGRLPDDELRAHLFGCSDCFRAYRAALTTRTSAPPAVAGWRAKLAAVLRPHAGLAWASVAALLLAVAWLTWTNWRAEPPRPLATVSPTTTQAPVLSATPGPPYEQSRTQRPPAPPRPSIERVVVENSVEIDLNAYVALRSLPLSSGVHNQTIVLSPQHTRLKLRLPEGSLPGSYRVSLLDEFEQPVQQTIAFSRTGKVLLAVLDLRQLAAKRFRLRLQRGAETPDDYFISIISDKEQEKN